MKKFIVNSEDIFVVVLEYWENQYNAITTRNFEQAIQFAWNHDKLNRIEYWHDGHCIYEYGMCTFTDRFDFDTAEEFGDYVWGVFYKEITARKMESIRQQLNGGDYDSKTVN